MSGICVTCSTLTSADHHYPETKGGVNHKYVRFSSKNLVYRVHKARVTFLSAYFLSNLKKSEQTKLGRLGVGGRDKCDGEGK